jgi:N-acetylmuramoyl-L-alanine amidase
MPNRTFPWLIALVLFSVLSVGCQPPHGAKVARFDITSDDEFLSTAELADMLDMKLDRADRGVTRIINSANTVLLFPAAGGAYVNGKSVGRLEDVMVFDGKVYVTRRLAKAVRGSLRAAAPKRPAAQPENQTKPGHVKGTVLLDAGHGGDDPGAIAPSGNREKDVVLAVALDLAGRLREHGVDVKFTRSSDVFVTLDGRVAAANRIQPDLFLSIHADASPNRSARGCSIFVPRREGKHSRSYQAGRSIASTMSPIDPHSRGLRVHEKNLRVLENTTCPAVLVELGFLTHRHEEQLLTSPPYQRRLAEALSTAVVQYLQK